MGRTDYVHGYDAAAAERLADQAAALERLLHDGTRYPAGSKVLEAGCGVGAQTVPLARNSPEARFLSVDIEPASVEQAAARVRQRGLGNVELAVGDVGDLGFEPEAFDHLFVCFLLEHLPDPLGVLRKLLPLVRRGGTVTVVEGDHGSVLMFPHSDDAMKAVGCQTALQAAAGGNACIGRQLYPLMKEAGCADVAVSPRLVHVDGSRRDLAEAFTRRTFAAMIEAVRAPALAARLIDASAFDRGITGLRRAAEPDGVFCYTFFKATARRAG